MARRVLDPFVWEYDDTLFTSIDERFFKPDYWLAQDAIIGSESGRGTTYFLNYNDHELVLRHYLRGGLVGKLIHDHYLYQDETSVRSLSEYRVLERLHREGLPVPKPAAAQVRHNGLAYQADILIERIPNARDLLHVLQHEPAPELFPKIGKLVARFHRFGAHHADLNIKNILLDQDNKLWLIDFDRAELAQHDTNKQDASLKRLKRSFDKEKTRHDIHFDEENWQALEQAYRQQMNQN